VDMAMGLGLIPEVIVDQHFHNRNRMARLMSAISGYPERLGIGIDEDTCAMFERDGTMTVIGCGTVTVIDARAMSHTNHHHVTANEPLVCIICGYIFLPTVMAIISKTASDR